MKKERKQSSGGWLRSKVSTFKKNWELLLLCIPTLVALFLFNYVPMVGLVMAFKKYTFKGGIFGSDWVGLQNFRFFFSGTAAGYIIRNTLGYFFLFAITGLITQVVVALLLYEVQNVVSLKIYQTCIQFPRFMSWAVIGFITYAIFNPRYGFLNQLLQLIGMDKIDVYSTQSVWPLIMTVVMCWQGLGAGTIMYYAKLMGTDPALYEAATVDGASRLQQIWHVSLPSLVPVIVIMQILNLAGIFAGSFEPFYVVARDVETLYPVTDNIATFIMRGLSDTNYGPAAAMGLIQSIIGLIMVVGTNYIVKKISPENALF